MKNNKGDLFVARCEKEVCDGEHIHIQIGFEGKPPLGVHVVDVDGARNVIAMLSEMVSEIEAETGSRLQ